MAAKSRSWFIGDPKTLSLFWSGSVLYLNVSLLRFTLKWKPIAGFGGFRHVADYR